jgi:hypothetical protein
MLSGEVILSVFLHGATTAIVPYPVRWARFEIMQIQSCNLTILLTVTWWIALVTKQEIL